MLNRQRRPFRMPTELADGLEVESLPEESSDPKITVTLLAPINLSPGQPDSDR